MMADLRSLMVAVVLGMAMTFGPTGGSASHADETTARAKRLYDDGLTNYNLGHYVEALAAFEDGYRLKHDPAFLFNVAQCQRQLHRYDDAQRSYRAYLRESADLSPATRDQMQRLIAEMQSALEQQRAAASAQHQMTPPAAPSTSAQPSPPSTVVDRPRSRPWYRNTAGLVLLASGVAIGVAGGAVFGIGVKDEHDAANAGALPVQRTLDSSAHTLQPAGIALLTIGGASIAVGAIVLAVNVGRRSEAAR